MMRFLIGFERDSGVQGRRAVPDSERSIVDAGAARSTAARYLAVPAASSKQLAAAATAVAAASIV
jgi:hypothetical protein